MSLNIYWPIIGGIGNSRNNHLNILTASQFSLSVSCAFAKAMIKQSSLLTIKTELLVLLVEPQAPI